MVIKSSPRPFGGLTWFSRAIIKGPIHKNNAAKLCSFVTFTSETSKSRLPRSEQKRSGPARSLGRAANHETLTPLARTRVFSQVVQLSIYSSPLRNFDQCYRRPHLVWFPHAPVALLLHHGILGQKLRYAFAKKKIFVQNCGVFSNLRCNFHRLSFLPTALHLSSASRKKRYLNGKHIPAKQ